MELAFATAGTMLVMNGISMTSTSVQWEQDRDKYSLYDHVNGHLKVPCPTEQQQQKLFVKGNNILLA